MIKATRCIIYMCFLFVSYLGFCEDKMELVKIMALPAIMWQKVEDQGHPSEKEWRS